MNQLASEWLSYVEAMLWQSSLVMLAIGAACWMLRRQSAALRYALLCLVLVKFLLPSDFQLATGAGQWAGQLLRPAAEASKATSEVEPVLSTVRIADPDALKRIVEAAAPSTTPAAAPTAESVVDAATGVLFGGWAAVVALLGAGLGVQMARLRRLLGRGGDVTDPALLATLDACRAEMGLRRPVELRALPGLGGPFLAGLWRPRICIAAESLETMTTEQLRPVLLHELGHLKRGDLWVNTLQILLQITWFFHPGLWLINWLIRREREKACDDLVLTRMKGGGVSYAESILNVVKQTNRVPSLMPGMLGISERSSAMKIRFARILDEKRKVSARLGVAGVLVVAAVAAILLPLAYSQIGQQAVAYPNEPGWMWVTPPVSAKSDIIGVNGAVLSLNRGADGSLSLALAYTEGQAEGENKDRDSKKILRAVAFDAKGNRYLFADGASRVSGDIAMKTFLLGKNILPAESVTAIGFEFPASVLTPAVSDKVAKTEFEMRALETGIEAYYIDRNAYPASTDDPVLGTDSRLAKENPQLQWNRPTFRNKQGHYDPLATLTTPIAYIMRYPQDPFANLEGKQDPLAKLEGKTFQFYSTTQIGKSGWILWSPGPDLKYDLNWKMYSPALPDPMKPLANMIYDPTNGTASSGDIVHMKR